VIATLSFVLAYAGFTAVCLAMERHHDLVWGHPPTRRTATSLRVLGFALLAAAAAPSLATLDGSTGIVAWFGYLTVAALTLIFLLPYAPRVAVGLAAVSPLATALATLLPA
jgi:Protein of unknown function (DUF3325)